ncbi:hypothetical protein Tco_0839791 [Tanacetum coccineum]|uniref:Uncharacterized protein n=1 Tax=Tanacetum coccineum TaxID=301880 RepID=A0ABQ5ATJ0_9ASTR
MSASTSKFRGENVVFLKLRKEIVEGGGKTVWGEPSAIGTVLEGLTFDVVLDYNGKGLDTVKPVVDWQVQDSFCSSAALDSVKADAGPVAVEKYLSEVFGNWASFRPQYMIGSGNNKDFEEWFFDRNGLMVPWTNERPLEKELNAIIGAWFTLWRY